jgi:hypothetical protein
MNRNFHDAWYHLRWAGRHLRHGVRDELRPLVARARRRLGREDEDEDEAERSRVDRVREQVQAVEPREAAERAREAVRGRVAR